MKKTLTILFSLMLSLGFSQGWNVTTNGVESFITADDSIVLNGEFSVLDNALDSVYDSNDTAYYILKDGTVHYSVSVHIDTTSLSNRIDYNLDSLVSHINNDFKNPWDNSDGSVANQSSVNIKYNNGNVSIGTIGSQEKLNVRGNVNLDNVYSVTADYLNPGYYVYKAGTVAYGMKLQYTGTKFGTMIFGPNQSNRFIGFGKVGTAIEDDDMIEFGRFDLNNGNFGINTQLPTEKFDVDGKARIRDLPIGLNTDKIVVADASGVLKTITALPSSSPAPFLDPNTYRVNQNTTSDITITGSFFTPTTTVTIAGQTVNSVTFISDNELLVNVTSNATDGFYDVIVNNGISTTATGIFEVKLSTWLDLRAGGDVFTDGNGAGNDIRYRVGMSLSRDAQGMSFNGSNPWSSWVKFESESWNRGDGKTLEWIFTTPTSSMMIGIGSDATNETNTAQYAQMETEVYFQNATTMWGLYGNNGTVGSAGNQSSSNSITSCTSGVYKIKFENDGGAGSQFTLYCLPSSNPSDWDNETNIITTLTVGGSLNPNETNIMPVILPRTGTQRFIALKVE